MTRSKPLAFTPPRMYVLKDVWADPKAARRAERMAQAWPGIEVRTIPLDDLPDVVVQEGWDHLPAMGMLPHVPPPIPLFGLFRFDQQAVAADVARLRKAYKGDGCFNFELAAGDGAFTFFCSNNKAFTCTKVADLKPNPQHVCRPQWRLHQGVGCPHQCAYCGLGGVLISHLNTETYIEKLADLLRRNPWQETWLYDDAMDVLTLEPQLDTLAPLMRFFESTRDRYLIIHTKSDRVEGLLEANAPKNTIGVWSLSGATQSSQLEKVAGTTESRIEAARVCQEAGLAIRYKFKPIIPVKNWREEADAMIDLALSRTRPDNLSMTVLMWMSANHLTACLPEDKLDPAFVAAARAAANEMKDSAVGPFPQSAREIIYRHYYEAVRKRDAKIPFTLSTESLDMWKALGPFLGLTPGNYVCGCGAGAIPGRKQLDRNPWADAKAALTWDGQPAFPADR